MKLMMMLFGVMLNGQIFGLFNTLDNHDYNDSVEYRDETSTCNLD